MRFSVFHFSLFEVGGGTVWLRAPWQVIIFHIQRSRHVCELEYRGKVTFGIWLFFFFFLKIILFANKMHHGCLFWKSSSSSYVRGKLAPSFLQLLFCYFCEAAVYRESTRRGWPQNSNYGVVVVLGFQTESQRQIQQFSPHFSILHFTDASTEITDGGPQCAPH